MIHIIYISIIIGLFWWVIRAYDFANRKHKDAIRANRSADIYVNAHNDFHTWMVMNNIKHSIIDKYTETFAYHGKLFMADRAGIAASKAGEEMRNKLIKDK